MVAGLPARVAVKSINSFGRGENVKGAIINNQGNEVATFETTHLGMGNFFFSPAKGESYTAKVVFKDGR